MRATLRGAVVTGAAAAAIVAALARLGAQPKPRTQFVSAAAGPIYIEDGGIGNPPVLFVHSYAGSGAHWASQLRHVRRTRRAIAMDLRGHGQSPPPVDNDYAVASQAGDIAAVADALGLDRFVLVGHSLGGAAAIEYAGSHQDRVAGLVLVGAPGKMPPQQAAQLLQSIEADYDGVMRGYWQKLLTDARPAVRQRILRQMDSVDRDASLAIIRATMGYDPLLALGRYAGPKFVVYTPHGDTPNDLQNLLPDIPQRRVERTSHWPHMDQPREFNDMLDNFLATVA